ncbi:MAG TPA: hypothetical protein DD435_05580 [Cyanobacteria bacterium UBA8530]|nr:hypothetical protein [Cyanobacteria bacterium UBA8530]
MGAKRIVFDAIDDLMAFLGNPKAERREIYRIHEWLEKNGYTGIITARMEGDDLPERYAYMQFMADCALRLDYRIVDGMSARQFKVVKYRGSDFAENEFPMVIGTDGIEVASVGITGHDIRYEISYERISTGVARLDGMLDGGVYRGTSILISGTPGTSKTILCGSFVQAACQRGEKALFISFDESNTEIVRNLRSVSIDLEKHVQSGLLLMYSARSEARSAEEYLMIIRKLLDEHNPSCVVIDPLSAILAAPSLRKSNALPRRLFHLLKQRGITVFCSSLISDLAPEMELTQTEISTIADTWIHLSFKVQAGERNRGLTIVKSRGTKHSHQVRELLISDDGATLQDVYVAGGEVLMGTLRAERENEEAIERQRIRGQLFAKQRDLEKAEIEMKLRSEALQSELELKRGEIALFKQEASLREKQWSDRFDARRLSRGADEDTLRVE